MMLPFEVTGRVLHEAERVDLWKTRNVSAFLMMLVKTVQHTPDRRDGGEDRVPYRNHLGGPRGLHYGMRDDNSYWCPPQGAHAYYGLPPTFMHAPYMPAGYAQAYPGYTQEYQFDTGYSMQNYPASPTLGPAGTIVVAPTSPQSGYSASPQLCCFVDGSLHSPGGAVAIPVSPNGMIEYSPVMGPVVMVASPQLCPQVCGVGDVIFEPMPLPPSVLHKYSDNLRDGTQTPEIGSDPGDCLHESLMNISTNIYNPDMLGQM